MTCSYFLSLPIRCLSLPIRCLSLTVIILATLHVFPRDHNITATWHTLLSPVIFVDVVFNDRVLTVPRDLGGDVDTVLWGQEVDPQQRVVLQGLALVEETLGEGQQIDGLPLVLWYIVHTQPDRVSKTVARRKCPISTHPNASGLGSARRSILCGQSLSGGWGGRDGHGGERGGQDGHGGERGSVKEGEEHKNIRKKQRAEKTEDRKNSWGCEYKCKWSVTSDVFKINTSSPTNGACM